MKQNVPEGLIFSLFSIMYNVLSLNEVFGFGLYLRMIHVFGFASRGFVPTSGARTFMSTLSAFMFIKD